MNTLLVGGIQYQQLEQGRPSDSINTSTHLISFLYNKLFSGIHRVEAMLFYEYQSTNIQYDTPNMLPVAALIHINSVLILENYIFANPRSGI